MVKPLAWPADTLDMDIRPGTDLPDALHRRIGARDGLLSKVSVMGQVTTLLAMASTGIVAGVLAHDAQMKDLLAAQARQLSAPTAAVPPATSPVVAKPLRTVVVGAIPTTSKAAKSRAATGSGTIRRTTTTARRTAPTAAARVRRVATTAPAPTRSQAAQPAPKPAAQPPATTSSGS